MKIENYLKTLIYLIFIVSNSNFHYMINNILILKNNFIYN